MTHPNREELAGRLEKYLAERAKMRQIDPDLIHGLHIGDEREAVLTVADLRAAAAALRQSPSVEEVARVIDPTLEGVDLSRPCWPTSRIGLALAKAQAIAALYGGEDG